MPKKAAPYIHPSALVPAMPKSLHTVTALSNLVYWLQTRPDAASQSDRTAMERALGILGYERTPDPYGLVDKAMVAYRKMSESGRIQK